MSIGLTIKCDICNIERQQTNHWFKISTPNPGFGRRLIITDFPPNQKIQRASTKIVCGHECLHSLINKLLS